MSKRYDIMAAGHLCLDIIPLFPDTGVTKIEEIMRPGKLVNVEGVKINTGGPVSNTGINMKTLGNKVCFCACVGDDELGNLTTTILKKNGNADGIHVVKGAPSSYTVVVAPPHIDRIFLHNPGTNNHFGPENLDSMLIKQCRHFHLGYPPLMARMFANQGKELAEIFKIAKKAGATTSCDMALPDPDSVAGKAPWRKILEKTLPYVDIFVPSIEEIFYMLQPQAFLEMKKQYHNAELLDYLTPQDYSRLADEILALGCKMTTLKLGYRGFYVKTTSKDKFGGMGAAKPGDFDNWANRQLWTPAFKVEKFGSAAGSGDSSIAGFLSAFLRGLDIEQALKYAACCGFQNVQVLDAVSGIKTWDETTLMVQSDMPVIDINIKQKDWCWSETHKLWAGPKDPLNK